MYENDRLDGWKGIAAYLNRSVRSAHRWNQELGLPVHRMQGTKGNIVYALKSEIDDWVTLRENGDEGLYEQNGPAGHMWNAGLWRARFRPRLVAALGVVAALVLIMASWSWLMPDTDGGGDLARLADSLIGGQDGPGSVAPISTTVEPDELLRPLGKAVFHSGRSGNPEIYVMNDDGSGLARLTHDPATDIYPRFSPDGSRVAFSSDRNGGQAQIFVMDSDGSNLRQLTSGIQSDYFYLEGLDWHPSGERLVFSFDIDEIWQLFEIDADGSNLIQLTNTAKFNISPRYSRDGTVIYMMRNTPHDGTTSEIFALSGGGARQLTFTLDNRAPDEILENGVPTLYFSKSFSKENQQIFRLVRTEPARGVKRISRLLRPAEYPLLFANNGFAETQAVGARGPGAALAMNQILVMSDRGGESMFFNIWRMGTDGLNAVRLTEAGGRRPDWWIPLAAVSGTVETGGSGGSSQ